MVKLIKERGIAAYPELLPPDKREARNIADLDVVEECVGLRPTRKGGVRLEVTSLSKFNEFTAPCFSQRHLDKMRTARVFPLCTTTGWYSFLDFLFVIHTFHSHGGAGYQSSWGSAKAAVDLLKSAVNE
jgi:hypothetical protein